jgi:hypothetical protein
LHGATSMQSLDLVMMAEGLRELEIQGPRTLDIGAVTGLRHLRSLTLIDIPHLTGIGALASVRTLRELRLDEVGAVDDPIALESLRRVSVVVTGRRPGPLAS